MIKRLLTGALLAVVLTPATAALAHAPGPTNFRTDIVAITPDLGWVDARIIGGDSFIELTVVPGHDVVAVGYKGERYLHFLADGTVLENVASITHYSNVSRFGGIIPADADPPAVERWVTVASRGRWAWHDHRTHWMNAFDPPGRQPGDVILEGVVPLKVDAREVNISVRSTWIAAPSLLAPLAFAVLGACAVVAAAAWRRRWVSAVIAVGGGTALWVGVTQYRSVPSALNPDQLAWVLPLAALCSIAPVLAFRRHLSALVVMALQLFAAVELLIWCVLRRLNLVRAILPTSLPFGVDRMVTAFCLGMATATIAIVVWPLVAHRSTPHQGALIT